MAVNKVAPSIVTNGLVQYLDIVNPKCYPGSGTTITDLMKTTNSAFLTGNSYSATNGGTITTTTQAPVNTNYISPVSNFTISAWCKYTAPLNYWLPIFASDTWLDNNGYIFGFETATSVFFGRAGSGITTGAAAGITLTNFNYFTFSVANDGTMKTYINGNLIKSMVLPLSAAVVRTIKIGARHSNDAAGTGYNDPRIVTVSNFKAYNRVLTDGEILQNYNAQKGRFNL